MDKSGLQQEIIKQWGHNRTYGQIADALGITVRKVERCLDRHESSVQAYMHEMVSRDRRNKEAHLPKVQRTEMIPLYPENIHASLTVEIIDFLAEFVGVKPLAREPKKLLASPDRRLADVNCGASLRLLVDALGVEADLPERERYRTLQSPWLECNVKKPVLCLSHAADRVSKSLCPETALAAEVALGGMCSDFHRTLPHWKVDSEYAPAAVYFDRSSGCPVPISELRTDREQWAMAHAGATRLLFSQQGIDAEIGRIALQALNGIMPHYYHHDEGVWRTALLEQTWTWMLVRRCLRACAENLIRRLVRDNAIEGVADSGIRLSEEHERLRYQYRVKELFDLERYMFDMYGLTRAGTVAEAGGPAVETIL